MEEGRQRSGNRRVQTDEGRKPADESSDKSTDGDAYIPVPVELTEIHLQAKTKDSGDGSIEEGRPVATELHTEASTSKTGTESNHPRRILLVDMLQRLQLLLVSVEIPVLTDSSPQHLTDLRDDRKLNAVGVDTLIFGERVSLIGEIHHDDIEVERDVDVLLRQSEIRLATLHVTHDTLAVGIARHEQGTGAHEEVELTTEELHGRGVFITLRLMVYHTLLKTRDALCMFVLSGLVPFQEPEYVFCFHYF